MTSSTSTGSSNVDEPSAFAALLASRRVIVCVGSGGVGKTTTAAAVALAAARLGRRSVVVTVDPARRLADALGVGDLPDQPVRVSSIDAGPGELWAAGLDTKSTFDRLVRTTSKSAGHAEAILENRFYRSITQSLSGTTEYLAAELVHELSEARDLDGRPRFDLLVVDTPPTRNAFDFITAPQRLLALLDNSLFKAVTLPARNSFKLLSVPAEATLRMIGSAVGGEVVADAIAFFRAFDGMEEGFRTRSLATIDLLSDDSSSGWVLVTSPRHEAMQEGLDFVRDIATLGLTLSAIVVNGLSPVEPLADAIVDELRALARSGGAATLPHFGAECALRDDAVAVGQRAAVAELLAGCGDALLALRVPLVDAGQNPVDLVDAISRRLVDERSELSTG